MYADQSGQNTLNVNTYYGPLGAVVGAVGATQTYYGGAATEKFTVDAIGNRHWTKGIGIREPTHPDVDPERTYTINAQGALESIVHPNPPLSYGYEKYLGYDGSGNLDMVGEREVQPSAPTYWNATRNFYDAGDKLRGFNRAVGPYGTDNSLPGRRSVFEEYFYDALGRRVMVRSRRHSGCPSSATECADYLERTVWDGDQVAWEIRAPAPTGGTTAAMESDNGVYSSYDGNKYGQTAYVHAGGIDQPITVYRSGYNGSSTPIGVHPHQNWRGVYELGSKTDGTVLTYASSPKIDWPGARATIDGAIARPEDGAIWFGNLIPGKTDGSGMQYMRNRYYDPTTGRFTQTDPIGLAGGMNLYGFAGGDPVNFSDPFGLSPDDGDCPHGYIGAGDTCYNQVAIIGMVLTGGGSRLFGAARSASAGVSNAWRAWRIARSGDDIMAAAQAGEKHGGFLRAYQGRSAGQIGRAARSLERHAAKHEGYLRDPSSRVRNWNDLTPQHQQSLIEGWKTEIQTAREQVEILRRIQ